MEGKLETANVVMTRQVLSLLTMVIAIVDLDLELIVLLKVKIGHNLFDELWIEIIMDYLGLTEHIPSLAIEFVYHAEGIRLGERVHVWQLLALEAE